MRSKSLTWLAIVPLAACAHAAGTVRASDVAPLPSSEPRELLPDQQVQQVLNRLAYGPRPGDAARVRAMGVDAWIAQQLRPETIDDHTTDELVSHYDALGESTSQMVSDFRQAQEARRRIQLAARADGDTLKKRQATRQAAREDPALADVVRRANRLVPELQSEHLARAVASDRQLQEVMVDFWENHFSVYAAKGQTRLFLNEYDRDVIRPHALGKFRDLLGAVAHSPAMLFYLDNWQSAADSAHPTLAAQQNGRRIPRMPRVRPAITPARQQELIERAVQTGELPPTILAQLPPEARERWMAATPDQRRQLIQQLRQRRSARGLNENYARELMELHTVGVNGGYTQQDVIEVARALTGWTIDVPTGTFVFRPQLHDAGEKHVLGHVLPAGRGVEDGEEVLDILASSPATARFIATKLVRHFVSDSAPPALVDRAAETFTRTGGDIRQVMRTIVYSPEFFSRAAYRAKVKTPFELVASALRAMGAQPDTTPRSAQLVAFLGQPIYGRLTPDGWPDRGDAWMNTGAILNRINFGLALAGNRVPSAGMRTWPLADSLRTLDREQQVDGVVRALLGGEVSSVTRRVLVSGTNPLAAAHANEAPSMIDSTSNEMQPPEGGGGGGGGGKAGAMRPRGGNALNRPVELQGLAQVVGLALGAPEFQRR